MLWRHRPRGLITVVKAMGKGVKSDDLREILRVETTHAKQQCRELDALTDKLIPAIDGLIQTLEQWTNAYPRINTTRALRRYKEIHRRDSKPLIRQLKRILDRI